jgi:hypothetical protein
MLLLTPAFIKSTITLKITVGMAQFGSSCIMALDQFNVVYVAWMLTVSVALGAV